MKRMNLVPNIITAFGLACGLFVIFKTNLKFDDIYTLLHSSMILILVAGIADLLDGAVARIIKAESDFGLIFDSLSDAITFGVAPAVIFIKTLGLEELNPFSFLAILVAMVYTIAGVLRLVRYSVKVEETATKNFQGLPIPSAAVAAVSVNLFLHSPIFNQYIGWGKTAKILILCALMLFLAYLMVSKLRFPSLKALHIRVPSFNLVMGTVIIAICLLYGILHFFAITFMVLSLGYALLGWILSIIRLLAGKKSAILKDFESRDDNPPH